MDDTLWIAVIATAAGTALMRVLPLVWMQRHLARRNDDGIVESVPTWLSILGPLMIAAMLGVSLTPDTFTLTSSLATLLGALLTLIVWYRTRSLGWPVFAGVLIYGAVKLLLASTTF